jgi:MFS family permease
MSDGPLAPPLAAAGQSEGYGRDFRFYATGQAVSIIGDRIALIALVFLVIHLSKGYALALSVFYVCRLLPSLFGGLLAGVVVDHFNRQRVMVGCDLARAALLVIVPGLSSLEARAVYPLVFVIYTFTVLFDTAARAALPDIVPASQVMGANAILRGIETAGDLAYAAGGVLVFALNLQLPFYIDAATFLYSALMISAMREPARGRSPLPRLGGMYRQVSDGIKYLMGQPFLKWSTVTVFFAPLAGGAIFVLAPLYASRVLGHSSGLVGPLRSAAFRFSVLEVSIGIGALLGSFLAARLVRSWPRARIFGLGISGMGAATALLALITNVYLAALAMAASGLFNSLFVVSGTTLVQTLTPSDIRGRVLAARLTVINTSLALGSAIGGALLLVIPYRVLWLVLGSVIGASSLFVWLRPEARKQA